MFPLVVIQFTHLRVSTVKGVPHSLMVYFMENPMKIRMMTGGTPISGNHHIYTYTPSVAMQNSLASPVPLAPLGRAAEEEPVEAAPRSAENERSTGH